MCILARRIFFSKVREDLSTGWRAHVVGFIFPCDILASVALCLFLNRHKHGSLPDLILSVCAIIISYKKGHLVVKWSSLGQLLSTVYNHLQSFWR